MFEDLKLKFKHYYFLLTLDNRKGEEYIDTVQRLMDYNYLIFKARVNANRQLYNDLFCYIF